MPSDEEPAWFRAALATPAARGSVTVEGADIAFSTWGEPSSDGLLLVHGGAANARWWDHIAPSLTEGRRVAAIDLSGHGDSGRRAEYTLPLWAEEVHAVSSAAGLGKRPTVVGHSMGGFVALQTALMYGTELNGVIVLDSPVHDITPEEQAAFEQRAFGPLRRYPTREAAVARFRPVPEQAEVLPYVCRHIAEMSVRRTDAGWTWKFDPAIFRRPVLGSRFLTRLACRVALFRSEHGRLSRQLSDAMYDRLGRAAPVIEIPAAGHHVMLDHPLSLVTGLRTLLSDWEHSTASAGQG